MIIIVARNQREADDYAHVNEFKAGQWRYARDMRDLCGIHKGQHEAHLIGYYQQHREYLDILAVLRAYSVPTPGSGRLAMNTACAPAAGAVYCSM